jgi:outer membrane protein
MSRFFVSVSALALSVAVLAGFASPAAAQANDKAWSVTVGAGVEFEPRYRGDDDSHLSVRPIISIGRGDSWKRFRTVNDGISIGLIDYGMWRAGPNAKFVFKRDSGDSADLAGLPEVGFTFELGGFVEAYPTDWLRLRAAVRQGIGGHKGLVGEAQADFIARFPNDWTLAVGPRLSLGSDRFMNAYFGTNVASGLGTYIAGGGVTSYGVGGQITKLFEPGWRVSLYAEYERLTGDAADSPLVQLRGSENQFTIGLATSYTFRLGL